MRYINDTGLYLKKINIIKLSLIVLRTYFKILLIAISISFITGYRVISLNVVYYFDILILLYTFSFFFIQRKIRISRFTYNIIKILLFIFLPSMILINFTNDISGSLKFFSQYLFTIVIIPLFLESLFRIRLYIFFLKSLLLSLTINSLYFMSMYFFSIKNIYFNEKFLYRFAIGDFTPNEMGHYFVLMLFLSILLFKNKLKLLIEPLAAFSYVLTFSKTVWVQIGIFLLLKRTKLLLVSCIAIITFLYFFGYLHSVFEAISLILQDFSSSTQSNQIRIEMFHDAIKSIPESLFSPGYKDLKNLDTSLSVHNGFVSFIVNFGLLSFLLLFFVSVFYIWKNFHNKFFRFILLFIVIDSIVLVFNPLINSRIVWLPLFLYIYTYYYKMVKHV